MNAIFKSSVLIGFCFNVFILNFLCLTATRIDSNEDPVPVSTEYKFHRRASHGISDPGSPWITGPNNKKYQFHIGRQSWLAAREHCLGQNSDLLTISTQKELDWILAHYSPQFPNLKDRLVQIGLLIDMEQGTREWHWVNKNPLNQDILSWISGEPFDHAEGRERCALLRVNEESIDDVDCDLPGTMDTMYRFVCERTHDEHVKHEEVNNPLWKKLQDILDFFGISGGQPTTGTDEKNVTRPGEDEEDYWELMKKNETATSNSVVNKTEEKERISSTVSNAQSEDIEGSGVEDNEVVKTSAIPPQAQAAKTLDNTLVSDELILNANLERINENETIAEVSSTNSPDVVILETASIETTRTTKADPLDKISSKRPDIEEVYIDALQKNMEKLENIVSAVEKMIDPLEGLSESQEKPKLEDGVNKKEAKPKEEEEKILKPTHKIETNETMNDALSFNTTDATNEIVENAKTEMDTVEAMEKDFEEAEHESQVHPNINSGDLVVTPEHQENIELCENENDNDNEDDDAKRTQKIQVFLKTLHRFLNRSSAKDLKELVEQSKKNGTSLLDRLNESISKAAESQVEKMETLKKKLNESIVSDDEIVQPDENKRENNASIIPIVKGHDQVQTAGVENNTSENEKNESTTLFDIEMPTATPEETTTNEAAAIVVSETESTKTFSSNEPDNSTSSGDEISEKNINGNATLDVNNEDEKNSSSNSLVSSSEQESTANFADKNEGKSQESNMSTTENSINGSSILPKSEEDKEDEEGHEVVFKIYLPKKNEGKEETVKSDDVDEKDGNKEIVNKSKEVTINKKDAEKVETENAVPKSRADRFPKEDSVFPTPRFDLLKPEELKQIPADINKAIAKEANNIGKIYDDFNKRIDTSALLKRIEESEKRRLKELEPLPIVTVQPKVTLAPSHDETEQKAMRELENLFEDLGRNFQQIVQG